MSTGALLPLAAGTSAFSVDTGSFLAIVVTSAVAATLVAVAGGRNLFIPVVVVELALGVVIGPQVLDLAHVDAFTQFFADLGLGMLFFFAGYEIDIARIRGEPLRLALYGWAMSLAIAYTLGGALAAAGVVVSLVYVGSALATTAIGTLLPILTDTGEMRTRFGTYLLAAGAVGEFGPILLLTLVLSTQSALHNALILIAFVGLAVAVAVAAVRSSHRTIPLFEKTIEKSSQLAVRWIVVLVFALTLLASDLGLDLLLGGFAAGLITRQVLQKQEVPVLRLQADRRRVRGVHPLLLRHERHDASTWTPCSGASPASRSSRCSSCSSSSSAERRRCCSTAASCRCARTARRSPSSPPPSCRSSSRSRPSRSTPGRCAPPPPPPSSAPERCRPSPARSTACGCGGSRR